MKNVELTSAQKQALEHESSEDDGILDGEDSSSPTDRKEEPESGDDVCTLDFQAEPVPQVHRIEEG